MCSWCKPCLPLTSVSRECTERPVNRVKSTPVELRVYQLGKERTRSVGAPKKCGEDEKWGV